MNTLKKTIATAAAVFSAVCLMACGGSSTSSTAASEDVWSGSWQDSTGQRATMDITAADSGYDVVITWSSSSTEATVWTLSAESTDDSTLSYTGKCATNEYGSDGTVSAETVVYEDGSGTLTLSDGVITVTGDDELASCTFEKVE